MGKVQPRDVTPIIAWIRNALNGRKLVSVHRFEGHISPRTEAPPALPGGPSHVLSKNWYCDRDGRRMAEPPKQVYHPKALTAGDAVATKPAVPKPGFGYNWSTGRPECQQ